MIYLCAHDHYQHWLTVRHQCLHQLLVTKSLRCVQDHNLFTTGLAHTQAHQQKQTQQQQQKQQHRTASAATATFSKTYKQAVWQAASQTGLLFYFFNKRLIRLIKPYATGLISIHRAGVTRMKTESTSIIKGKQAKTSPCDQVEWEADTNRIASRCRCGVCQRWFNAYFHSRGPPCS